MPARKTIFVGSTSEDLQEYRSAVREQIIKLGFFPDMMESWTPGTDQSAVDLCRAKIENADLYICIVAHRYGWQPPGYGGRSITELEYEWAGEYDIPRLCFIVSEKHPWATEYVDPDRTLINAFHARLKEQVVGFFTTPADLGNQAAHALFRFIQETRQPSISADSLRAYLEAVIRAFENIEIGSITGQRNHIPHRLPLQDVFIVLRAHPGLIDSVHPPEVHREIVEGEPAEEANSPVLIKAVVESSRHLALLGDPGSGKTTLLRYVALRQARAAQQAIDSIVNYQGWQDAPTLPTLDGWGPVRIPIVVSIARYAEARTSAANLSLHDFIPRYLHGTYHFAHSEQDMRDLFEALFERGLCLFLFDGLDEILTTSDRKQIADNIKWFSNQWRQGLPGWLSELENEPYPGPLLLADRLRSQGDLPSSLVGMITAHLAGDTHGSYASSADALLSVPPLCNLGNRFLVTSRTAGYLSSSLGSGFAHYTLLPLTDDEIEQFVIRCLDGFERPRRGETNPIRRLSDEFIETLRKEPALSRLARNPLHLLLIISRRGEDLPRHRIDLYQMMIRYHLLKWQLSQTTDDIFDESRAIAILGPLALWMHENRPSGLVSEIEIKNQIAGTLAQESNGNPVSPALHILGAAGSILERIRQHSGILLERSDNLFGFMHLTFEEYFAARALTRSTQEFNTFLGSHLHQARWREVLLLGIGLINQEDPLRASQVIRGALDQQSPFENILHRDLLFACTAICECAPDHSRAISEDIAVRLISTLTRHEQDQTVVVDNLRRALSALWAVDQAAVVVGLTAKFQEFSADEHVLARLIDLIAALIPQTQALPSSLYRALERITHFAVLPKIRSFLEHRGCEQAADRTLPWQSVASESALAWMFGVIEYYGTWKLADLLDTGPIIKPTGNPLIIGSEVTLLRPTEILDDGWQEGMTPYIGKQTKVIEILGRDVVDSWTVRVAADGGRFVWRVRDLSIRLAAADGWIEGAMLNGTPTHPLNRGETVLLRRQEAVPIAANWTSGMQPYVGRRTTVSERLSRDANGLWRVRVDADGGAFTWRLHDLYVHLRDGAQCQGSNLTDAPADAVSQTHDIMDTGRNILRRATKYGTLVEDVLLFAHSTLKDNLLLADEKQLPALAVQWQDALLEEMILLFHTTSQPAQYVEIALFLYAVHAENALSQVLISDMLAKNPRRRSWADQALRIPALRMATIVQPQNIQPLIAAAIQESSGYAGVLQLLIERAFTLDLFKACLAILQQDGHSLREAVRESFAQQMFQADPRLLSALDGALVLEGADEIIAGIIDHLEVSPVSIDHFARWLLVDHPAVRSRAALKIPPELVRHPRSDFDLAHSLVLAVIEGMQSHDETIRSQASAYLGVLCSHLPTDGSTQAIHTLARSYTQAKLSDHYLSSNLARAMNQITHINASVICGWFEGLTQGESSEALIARIGLTTVRLNQSTIGMFDLLCEYALPHQPEIVRYAALLTIAENRQVFPLFDLGPAADLTVTALQSDSRRLKRAALSLAQWLVGPPAYEVLSFLRTLIVDEAEDLETRKQALASAGMLIYILQQSPEIAVDSTVLASMKDDLSSFMRDVRLRRAAAAFTARVNRSHEEYIATIRARVIGVRLVVQAMIDDMSTGEILSVEHRRSTIAQIATQAVDWLATQNGDVRRTALTVVYEDLERLRSLYETELAQGLTIDQGWTDNLREWPARRALAFTLDILSARLPISEFERVQPIEGWIDHLSVIARDHNSFNTRRYALRTLANWRIITDGVARIVFEACRDIPEVFSQVFDSIRKFDDVRLSDFGLFSETIRLPNGAVAHKALQLLSELLQGVTLSATQRSWIADDLYQFIQSSQASRKAVHISGDLMRLEVGSLREYAVNLLHVLCSDEELVRRDANDEAPFDPNVLKFMRDLIRERHGTSLDSATAEQEAVRLYTAFGNRLVSHFEPQMTKRQAQGFDALVELGRSQDELLDFLVANIPGLEHQIMTVLMRYRAEYLRQAE